MQTPGLPSQDLDSILRRELLPGDVPGLRTAATVVNGVLITRWIGRDARRLRHCFGRYWAGFRARAAGLPARLPRLWEI